MQLLAGQVLGAGYARIAGSNPGDDLLRRAGGVGKAVVFCIQQGQGAGRRERSHRGRFGAQDALSQADARAADILCNNPFVCAQATFRTDQQRDAVRRWLEVLPQHAQRRRAAHPRQVGQVQTCRGSHRITSGKMMQMLRPTI